MKKITSALGLSLFIVLGAKASLALESASNGVAPVATPVIAKAESVKSSTQKTKAKKTKKPATLKETSEAAPLRQQAETFLSMPAISKKNVTVPVLSLDESQLKLQDPGASVEPSHSKWIAQVSLRSHQAKSQVVTAAGAGGFSYNTDQVASTFMPSFEFVKITQDETAKTDGTTDGTADFIKDSKLENWGYLLGVGFAEQKMDLRTPSNYLLQAKIQSYEIKAGLYFRNQFHVSTAQELFWDMSPQWVEYQVFQTSDDSLGQWHQQASLIRLVAGLGYQSKSKWAVHLKAWSQVAARKSQDLETDRFNAEVGSSWLW